MKITFLIGNGFDIALGIKSSYGDFYKWYCDQPSIVKYISEFKKDIKEDINRNVPDDEKTWADFELGLGKYSKKFTKETVDQFLNCYEDAQENIVEYLKIRGQKFDVHSFSDNSIEKFKNSIRYFYNYLADDEIGTIKSFVEQRGRDNIEISFYTFNYTNTLESILSRITGKVFASWKMSNDTYEFKISPNVFHIHGTLNEYPVIGVNDETQIENKELLETNLFKDFIIKENNIKKLGKLWHSQMETQISNSRIICLYGVSIGDSDAKWWRKLIQWLKAHDSRHIIIFWYEKTKLNTISSRKQIQCVDDAKNKLLSYTKLSENDIDRLKQRIHVVINSTEFLQLEDDNAYLNRVSKELSMSY